MMFKSIQCVNCPRCREDFCLMASFDPDEADLNLELDPNWDESRPSVYDRFFTVVILIVCFLVPYTMIVWELAKKVFVGA